MYNSLQGRGLPASRQKLRTKLSFACADCLVVNERDWTACQVQVKAFRECFEAAKKAGVKVEPKHQRSNL